MTAHPSPLDVARELLQRGWMPLPVPYREKNPGSRGWKGWQNFTVTEDELPQHFNGQPLNIGVLLGDRSGGRVDVDLDCLEAIILAPRFLTPTEAIFGRESKPRSHWQYLAPGVETTQFADISGTMLLELRSTGAQTIFPGSTHETGEPIEWAENGAPARIDASDLRARVGRLAAACLLARHWPRPPAPDESGNRHHASLALAGGLIRVHWSEDEVAEFIEAICTAANDDETHARVRNVVTTAEKQAREEKFTGWPTLARIIDQRLVDKVCEWLNISPDPRAQARNRAWDEPEPLPDGLLSVPGFDARLLPEALRSWIADVSERMQCSIEFPSVAALVAAASLVGNRVRIRPKREDDWTVVPNLWGAVVGKPGVLKTPACEEALKPLRVREALARNEHQKAVQDFEFERDYAEAQRSGLRKRMQKADAADKELLRAEYAAAALTPPVEHRYVTNDPTTEKLGEILNQNPRGVLLYRDELTGWFRSLDREGREQDRSFYLETWTGSGDYTYDRIGRGTLRIENLTLSIFGTVQPGPLTHYLRGAIGGGSGDDGLMQRFQLLVYPDPLPEWRNVDRAVDGEAARRAHECFARLDMLDAEAIGTYLLTNDTGAGYAFIRFEDEAQEFFNSWRGDLEVSLRTGEFEHPALEAHMAKYRSLMPSLALIFHLMDRVNGITEAEGVTLDAAQRAAAWCTFLEAHARRVYGLALNADVQRAKTILEHLRRGNLSEEFTARDVYSKHWAGLATSKDVAEPLSILEDYGWLRSFALPGTETGGRPTVRYLVHPSLRREGTE